MKLTDFEKTFFLLDNPKETDLKKVVYWFHLLLMKVEADPYRQWTHDLLRNYVDAFYALCNNLTQRNASNVRPGKREGYFQKPINVYSANELELFFTGLYSPNNYQGVKNGLYFVRKSKEVFVMSRKEIIEKTGFLDLSVLDEFIQRDSFENELWNRSDLTMNEIRQLEKTTSVEAYEKIDEVRKQNNSKQSDVVYEPKGKLHGWLHVLYDGIDNLPTEFVKSFFDLSFENLNLKARNEYRKEKLGECIHANNGSFEIYQDILIETFHSQIARKDELPIIFYKKESRFNYLLPMYLQNSAKPDFCIVLGLNKEGNFWRPVTSLNMDEVYCDIRVFGKDAILSVRDWW